MDFDWGGTIIETDYIFNRERYIFIIFNTGCGASLGLNEVSMVAAKSRLNILQHIDYEYIYENFRSRDLTEYRHKIVA